MLHSDRLKVARKLGYREDSPEVAAMNEQEGERKKDTAAPFEENYTRMVKEMHRGGLIPSNAADLETTSARVKAALTG